MLILSQTNDIHGHHGTVGTPTNMCDSQANPLFVGDIVTIHHKDYLDKTVAFVCEEIHKYANWTGVERQYVMGIAGKYNSDNFKQITASVDDDAIFEQLDAIADGWVVRKVKDFSKLVINEQWGFLFVRDVTDVEQIGKDE